MRGDLTTLYEQLRQQALMGLSAGQGMALLLARGLKAWIQAWSLCAAPSGVQGVALPATRGSLPVQLHAELAVLLAGMALIQRRGERR